VALALLLLLGTAATNADAEHHGYGGPYEHPFSNTQNSSAPHEGSSVTHGDDGLGTGASHMSSKDQVTQRRPVNTRTTTTTTSKPASNVLPQVPDTDLSQVPPVPMDPFVMAPVTLAPPPAVAPQPPVSKPMTVGLGAAQVYQVNCVVSGGSYCSFTNSYFVARGSTCHCGSAVGTTE
jgi:hypothetical protein